MGTQIAFPNKRLPQAGIGNPLFVTDIENMNEDLLEALAILYGFAVNGFAILSGFDYGAGAYTGGVVYMNGSFYKCVAGLAENKWLTPNVQDIQNKIFSDLNTYATYRTYQAIESNVVWGGMPQFVGNMNAYRVSIKKLVDLCIAATETNSGFVELATDAETQTGTATDKVITPANLQAVTGTETRKGVLELATVAEVQTGTDTERAITPAGLTAKDGGLITKIVEIGDWNMNTNSLVTINHGDNPDPDKIVSVRVLIRDDGGALEAKYPLDYCDISSGGEHVDGSVKIGQVVFTLYRRTGGFFDSVYFQNTSFNRGWIIIQYLP